MNSYRTFVFAVAIVAAGAGQAQAQWLANGAKMYYNSGNVGVGTSNPAHRLDVRSSGNRAISAQATANSGDTVGVWGQSKSPTGTGVLGLASAITGVNFGVYGKTNSPEGYAAYFEGDAAMTGNLGIGTDDPQAKLHIAGTPGVDGIQFPDGTVQTTAAAAPALAWAFASGSGNNPSAATTFLGPTVSITITSGRKILVQANKAFGSAAVGGATGLGLYVGYRVAGSGATPTLHGGGILGIHVPQNTRVPMGITGIISGLPAGTYEVGMAGSSNNAANWNSNEYGYVSALAFD